MAYVNEKISDEDYEKYNLAEIDKRLRISNPSSAWTIDREREIWLRLYRQTTDRDNFGEEIYTIWDFYRKGYLISVKTEGIKWVHDKERNEVYQYLKILSLEIPKEIENEKEQILKELKKAFEESGGNPYSRIRGSNATHKIDLEYNGELI
ncbi:MAG: hypothetical protein LBG67_00870 [Campylobacteraceae bacterium]|jgi:hypothetical protein|nr:hypothetical protein [Campylobacteraceae bacterium]